MKNSIVSRWSIGMFAIMMVVVLCSTPVQAYYDWTGTSGNWTNAANWNQSVKPTSADRIYIRNGGTAIVTTAEVGEQLHLGSAGGTGGNGTIEIQASGELASSTAYLGESDGYIGTINQSGGVYTNSSAIRLATAAGSQGTYNLSNDGIMTTTAIEVGWKGVGVFNQSSGSNTVNGNVRLCVYSGSSGTYNMNGGLLDIKGDNDYTLGIAGYVSGTTGTFVHTAGTVLLTNSGQDLKLGTLGNGTYRLGGSAILNIADTEYIGGTSAGSMGTFIQTGGTHTVGSEIFIRTNGCLRGWGTVGGDYTTFYPDGLLIADGYGNVDHSLVLTNYNGIYPNLANGSDGTNGYYAVNQGRLILKPFAAGGEDYWGGSSTFQSYVNSVKLRFGAVTDGGNLTGSLYATDHSEIPPFGSESKITAIWEFDDTDADPVAAPLDYIRFRYDPVKAAELSITEADLRVWTHAGGEDDDWTKITDFGIDTTANMITASNLTDVVGWYAVASEVSHPGPKGTVIILQ